MLHFKVSLFIAFDLVHPEIGVGLRDGVVLAPLMAMPEASVDEDARSVHSHHDVWFPRQSWMIQPVAESTTPQILAYKHLRLRVLSTNARQNNNKH